jgi:hypothetical protein
MKELKAYTGDFDPNLRLEDLSKEVLVNLLREYARLGLLLEAQFNSLISQRFGAEAATDINLKARMVVEPIEMGTIKEILGVPGNDVVSMIKTMHWVPDGPLNGDLFQLHYDIKNNNHVIMTITKCKSMEYYERHGDQKGMKNLCEVLEPPIFNAICQAINPDMKMWPLKLPPRKSKEDICCQWEIKIEPRT